MITESLEKLAEVALPSNPFPGLRPFNLEESYLFFGRDHQSERLIDKLAATRFLAVVGTSGSGKSSLVRAGLLPALLGGMMAGAGSNWRMAAMRPGSDPVGNLARALNEPQVFGSEIPENAAIQIAITEATLRYGNRGLIAATEQAGMPPTENLLVLVDQFEEVFRFAREARSAGREEGESYENQAAAFVKLLLEAHSQRDLPIYVVLTMRSDFLGDCSKFWGLPETINESQYLIPRLTRDQLRKAITGPVSVAGGKIAQPLVTRLLNDIGDNQDQLPILQHALMRTWEKWKEELEKEEGDASQLMDMRHYEATGGMAAALSNHADEAYNELNDEQKRIAELMFKSLTEKGEDNREIRRPVSLREICEVADAAKADVAAVIETFRQPGRSLLTPPADTKLNPDSVIDISHESLIRVWGRLKAWTEEEAASARRYRWLDETAMRHLSGDAELLRGADQARALEWLAQTHPTSRWARRYAPNFGVAMRFLEESRKAHLNELAVKIEQAKRARRFSVLFAILAILAIALAVFYVKQKHRAEEGERLAEGEKQTSRRLLYSARMKVAQQAYDEKNYLGANDLLSQFLAPHQEELRTFYWYHLWRLTHNEQDTLHGHGGRVNAVAFSPDGKILASASSDGTIRLWDLSGGRKSGVLKGHFGAVWSISIAAGGNLLASAGDDKTIKLWDLANGQELFTFPVQSEPVFSVAFAPDGKTLASGGADKTIKLWDVISKNELPILIGSHESFIRSIAFASDGKMLASGASDGKLKLWDVANRKLIRNSLAHQAPVTQVAFAPDGKSLASASDDITIKIWNVANGRVINKPLEGHTHYVRSIAFTPDGKTLISAGYDQTIKLWDVASQKVQASLKGHSGYVHSISVTKDGTTLASGGEDNLVKLWELPRKERKTDLIGHKGKISSIAFSPDSQLLASGSDDRTVRLWKLSGGEELTGPVAQNEACTSVVFVDRQKLAFADGTRIRLWDASRQSEFPSPVNPQCKILALSFSPKRNALAGACENGTVKLWNFADGVEINTLRGHTDKVLTVAFAPDGKTLVSASMDKTIKLWDASSGQVLATLQGHSASVQSIAFEGAGEVLASASADMTIKLWNVATRREIATLIGHGKNVVSLAFAPNGKTLASASWDGTLRLWDVSNKQELATLRHDSDAPSSRSNWAVAFAPDGNTLAGVINDKTIRLYLTTTDQGTIAQQRNQSPPAGNPE